MSDSVRQQARRVKDPVEAARLRERFSRRLLEDEQLRDDHADNLAEAVDDLEERFPEIQGLAIGEANDFARRRESGKPDAEPLANAAGAAGELAGERGKARKERANKRNTSRARPNRRTLKRRLRRSRSSALRREARWAARETGIPGATRGAAGTLLSILGLTVGLTLLYLIVSDAESSRPGRSAIAQIAGGTAKAVEALLLPTDPLAKVGNPGQAAAPAGPNGPVGKPGRTPSSSADPKGPIGAAPAGPRGPVGLRPPRRHY
jgi:hypothetical protein